MQTPTEASHSTSENILINQAPIAILVRRFDPRLVPHQMDFSHGLLGVIWVTDRLLALKPSLVWIEGAFGILLFTALLFIGSLRLFSNFTYTRHVNGKASFHGYYPEPKHGLADKMRETLPARSRVLYSTLRAESYTILE